VVRYKPSLGLEDEKEEEVEDGWGGALRPL